MTPGPDHSPGAKSSAATAEASLPGAPTVLIVGGGLAGLACAAELANGHHRVTVLESRPKLGGRASSFVDAATGEAIDNCQHVSMGCCTWLADFCKRTGIHDLFEKSTALTFVDEKGVLSRLQLVSLPPPLHLAPGFLGLRFLSLSDKLRIAWGIWRLARTPATAVVGSFQTWLLANGQNRRTSERFWGLILTSALNESLDRIDFRYARQVFLEGFLAGKDAATVFVPRAPLGELYGDRLKTWFSRHGVDIRLNTAVKELVLSRDLVAGVRTRSGELVIGDQVVLAVPPTRLLELLPADETRLVPLREQVAGLEYSPITSVHLWYDRPVMKNPHLVLVGRTTQWLFQHPSHQGESAGSYVQAVVSASRDLSQRSRREILEIVVADVERALPSSKSSRLVHSRVVTERYASFSIVPGVDRFRPGHDTPVPNLYVAGDFTDTGWPATMESAVRSGYQVARMIAHTGRDVRMTHAGENSSPRSDRHSSPTRHP